MSLPTKIRLCVVCFALFWILFTVGEVYHFFVFLPDFHGSWKEALKSMFFDFEGLGAFLATPMGWITFGGGLFSLVLSFLLYRSVLRDLGDVDEEDDDEEEGDDDDDDEW